MKLYAVVWPDMLRFKKGKTPASVFRLYRHPDQCWRGVAWLTTCANTAASRLLETREFLDGCFIVEIEYEGE